MACACAGYCRKTFETLLDVIPLAQQFLAPLNLRTNGSDPASIRIDDTATDLGTNRQAELLRSFLAQLSDQLSRRKYRSVLFHSGVVSTVERT